MSSSSPEKKKQPQIVQIQAPCAMEAGFTFLATYNDASFPVTVPPGGVKEGQVFSVPYPSMGELTATEVTPFLINNHSGTVNEPIGHWKDGLFACCAYGPCHPSLWNAVCCPQILMAQILTRLKLDWMGNPAVENEWKDTFKRIMIIICIYWLVTIFLAPPDLVQAEEEEEGEKEILGQTSEPVMHLQLTIYHAVSWGFSIYTLIVMTRLRRLIRSRHQISPACPSCESCEDFCISFCCGCCSVAQMARQTCDYERQTAACCSSTGIGATPLHLHESVLTV